MFFHVVAIITPSIIKKNIQKNFSSRDHYRARHIIKVVTTNPPPTSTGSTKVHRHDHLLTSHYRHDLCLQDLTHSHLRYDHFDVQRRVPDTPLRQLAERGVAVVNRQGHTINAPVRR